VDILRARLESAAAALRSLEEALALDTPSALERDGGIQRFEYTFEVLWKACRSWLELIEGVQCASPRSCLRALGAVGLLDLAETAAALAVVDDRNLTVHTYQEETARAIFSRLPAHTALMREILERMERRMPA
jgi:nucleotidyltransferase substrate binding protein (TIGR01987 family)